MHCHFDANENVEKRLPVTADVDLCSKYCACFTGELFPWVMHSHIIAMEAAMVSLLLKQLLLWKQLLFTLPCPTCDPTPHSTPHVPHLTRHSRSLHCTLPSPLQSPKRLRKREDTSSPWHTCPTPLHLVEGMSLHPSSDHMGWNLSFHLSFMSCVELSGTILYTLCNVTLWTCYTCQHCCIPHMHVTWLSSHVGYLSCNIMEMFDLVHKSTLLYPSHASSDYM